MSAPKPSPPLSERDIAYCYCLHLNTATIKTPPNGKGHAIFEVEGKARPVVILSDDRRDEFGARWYRVARTTTKPHDKNGNIKRGYKRIGTCVDPERVSYLFCYPEWYPANLVKNRVRQLNLLEFCCILKIMNYEKQS